MKHPLHRFRIAAGLLCAAPALLAMWPVLLARHTTVPGLDPGGDNLAALWNVWWFIESRHVAGWPYWTPLLFAPVGTQLALHTHATTHSLLAWAWATATSLPAAHNIALTLGLALNGVCAYLLALRVSGHALPAVVGGVLFGASAAVQLRALGHINLVHAWVLPLFALALLRSRDDGAARAPRAVVLGAAGALVLYTDYYYAVYAVVLTMIWTALLLFTTDVTRRPKRTGRIGAILLVLILLVAALIAVIALTGGTAVDLGFARVSIRGLNNPLTLFWILVAGWTVWRYPARISVRWREGLPPLRNLAPAAVAVGTFVVLSLPLLLALLRVVAAGDYTTQRILWRSSPPGGDLVTLVLGHPRHALTGGWTSSAYATLGVDVMEQGLWLGIVPIVFLLTTRRDWRFAPAVRLWIVAAVVFGVMALGPFLRIAGVDTALPLPHAVLRYVPVFSNARIPGRAVVMVQLAVAVLLAHALARRSRGTGILLLALVAAETFPARLPLQMLPPADGVDEVLRTSPSAGAVAELPLGLRDGLGHQGSFDHRALVHQTAHGRPLVGGFVARLAPGIRQVYEGTPVMRQLMRLSTEGETEVGLTADAAEQARLLGIRFVVVNRDTFIGARLPRSELERAGFRFVHASGAREAYETVAGK